MSLLVLLGLGLGGCAAETRENFPRPPVPTTVSVYIGGDGVQVNPERIGVPGQRPVNISQNANAQLGQAPRVRNAIVDFRVANDLDRPVPLVVEGPVERLTRLPATGSTSFKMGLPTGLYRLGTPALAGTARLSVGPSRVSSGTSVLTP